MTDLQTERCPFGEGWDFTDPDLIEKRIPLDEFAQLRENAPVWWNEQPDSSNPFADGGYWAITRHADICAISKNPTAWSTNANGAVIRLPEFVTADQIDLTKALIINQDPPQHTRLRKVVSRMFTPRMVLELEEKLKASAERIVRTALEKGSGDFVHDIAVDLPLTAIFDLIGIPTEDHAQLFEWANAVISTDDPESELDPAMANAQLLGYAYQMADARKNCPADDIVTKLVEADIDGEAIDQTEFGFFVLLLAVAGNETTRNAITHGMNAFFDNPDQWELWKKDRPKSAADEIVRWATPVNCFQRTALVDVELGGVTIKAGQRAGLFYSSANYDESVFENPFTFDIMRSPNPHLGFGGNGTHFCLGSNLARREIDIMFNTIADLIPDISKVSEPTRLRSGWINGIKDMQVSYTG